MTAKIIVGDCMDKLSTLPEKSVQACITSPPYWGLRDYGVDDQLGLERVHDCLGWATGNPCGECYVCHTVAWARGVRPVLRDDGVLWVVIGDSYASGKGTCYNPGGGENSLGQNRKALGAHPLDRGNKSELEASGLKPKDLVGIPWRVALALQADGWWLRSDVVWAKPNPMPESVTDRPTKAHEYVFLFAKGQWKSRIVKLANLPSEFVHFRNNIGLGAPNVGASKIAVFLATAILNGTESKEQFCLPPLDSQVWQEGANSIAGEAIANGPIMHQASMLSTRLLNADISAKEFLGEIYRLGITLTNRNQFIVGGSAPEFTLPPGAYSYGDATITVYDSSQICKFDFVHGQIITQSPTSCKYYWDQDAVREPAVYYSAFKAPGNKHSGPVDAENPLSRNGTGQYDGYYAGRENEIIPTGANGRNIRTVWTVATKPYSGAHFATFPTTLVETMIKASTKEGDTVLDPFGGAGTTALVASRLNRDSVLIELNPEYATMAERRVRDDAPLLVNVTVEGN